MEPPRTLVVRPRARLPKMAKAHIRIGILPGRMPRMHLRHPSGRHASAFARVAPRRGLRRRDARVDRRRRRSAVACAPARAPRSRPPHPLAHPRIVLVEIRRGALKRDVPRAGTFVRQAPGEEPRVLELDAPRHISSTASPPPRIDALWVPTRVSDTRHFRAPRHAVA